MLRVAVRTNSLLLILLVTVSGAVTAALPTGRVVNGTNTRVENYPHVVSLRIHPSGSHLCGGSIISEWFVMTAAHCTEGRIPAGLSVQYGVTNISSNGANIVAVKKILQHELYDSSKHYAYDISLVQVANAFVFNYRNVAPVQLPEQNFATPQTEEGGLGTLIGWGLNKPGGFVQTTMQHVDLKIYSDKECAKRHGASVDPAVHICGGVDEGGKGQCSGDSGGPLMYHGTQVGIVSWSIKPCTIAPYPGVYGRVSSFEDWISSKRSEIV